jgi:hypothetical protein
VDGKENLEIWLDLVPEPNEDVKTSEGEGGVVLLIPMSSPLDFLAKRIHGGYRKLKLDGQGAFVWNLCDGKRSVRDVGNHLRERFGDEAEPLYERLVAFLMDLRRRHLIDLKSPEGRTATGV